MRGLYPIVDLEALAAAERSPLEVAQHVIAARPALLQLRAKRLSARETLALLRALVPLCRTGGVRVFANDRPDLALLAGCDGVHVGRDDVPVREVRRIAPALRVGVSTHTLPELEAALDEQPDYVAFGPVFATQSKLDTEPVVGLDGLAAAAERARARGIPLCAIGGIGLESIADVARHADLAAVIGALVPKRGEDLGAVTARARRLAAAFEASR